MDVCLKCAHSKQKPFTWGVEQLFLFYCIPHCTENNTLTQSYPSTRGNTEANIKLS